MSAKKQTARKNKKSKTPARTQKGRSRAKMPETVVHKGLSPRVRAIIYGAIAVIFALMIIIKGENVWTAVRSFFFGVFGFGIFLIPILMIYLCLMTEKEKQVAHFKAKIIISSMIILLVGALIYIVGGAEFNNVNFFACLGKLYIQSADTSVYMTFGCGLMGGILGYPLTLLCGEVAALCVCIVAIVMLVFIIANISVKDMAAAASRTVSHVREAGEKHARERKARKEAERENQQTGSSEVPMYIADTHVSDGIDIPLDDPKTKKKKDKHKVKSGIDIDYVDTNEQNAADKDLSEDLINIINRASKPLGEDADTTVADIAEDISQGKASNHMTDGAKQADPETVPIENERKAKNSKSEEKSEFDNVGYKPDNSSEEVKEEKIYHYPPVQLLKPNTNNNDRNAMEELQNNSKKLIETLQSFGVNATITNICRGPSVTRYELQPAPGVKISKITNLSDDIALNLAANGVRIEAPIPGKAAVGIEVPNKVVSMVSMRELIDSDKFRNAKSKLTTVLGRDISGEIVVTDLAKMPHLLIAGTTGSGKSVCVNSILMSILFKATPDEVKLLLIDPKMVEFSKYKGIPHLLVPVVSDAKKAAGALAWAVNEMLQRYKIFSEYDCKDIDSYNTLIEKNLDYISKNPPVEDENGEIQQPVLEINGLPVAKEKMSRVVIAIDELADLMMAAPSEVEDSICRLAQMARAAGMHLILATQRPTVNVITGLIKANVPSRISLKVSSNMDSRTILDTGGGEKLIGKGDMLFAPVGAPKPMRVQGCYASDEEIEGVTNYIKKSYSAQYNADIEEKIKRIAAEEIATGKKQSDSSSDDDGLDVDSKMDEAIKCVIEAGQASTSLIQRRLKVGYARAGRMIDDMEQLGVVGPHQGSKPRDVLMTYNEWLERRNALQNR
ncbi:MAG: DNA translocase FtsK [Ruminococcus sp.]